MFDQAPGDILPWGVLVESNSGGIPVSADAAGFNDSSMFEFYADSTSAWISQFPNPGGIPYVMVIDTRDMTIVYTNSGHDRAGLLAAIDTLLQG